MMNLDECLLKIVDKNEFAFDQLYNQTYKVLFHIVFSVLRNYQNTQDCLQDVFVTIYNKADKYQKGSNAKAFLYTIAKNTALNHYNKYKRSSVVDISSLENVLIRQNEFSLEDCASLKVALKYLDEQSYQILMMCVIGGYKRREVAEITKLPISTVTWKLNSALKVLKQILEAGDEN